MKLTDLLGDTKAAIMLGSGGVGKTTSSVGLAILAASEGKRVAVLSIDPSKRLAKALGFEPTSSLQLLSLPFIENGKGGSVHAAVVDQKKIFDDVVRKFGKSKKQIDQILSHSLYKAASSNLSGPIEYMSLAKFGELMEDDRFDLVILDTPPDNNALDFLARPNILAGFIDKKIMKWLVKPFALAGKFGFSKLLTVGEKLMGGLAKITGVSMLSQFANFLVMMQEVIEGFHSVGSDVLKILNDEKTRFFMVVSVAEDRMPGVEQFCSQLNDMGYELSGYIANRCLSADVQKELESINSKNVDGHIQHYLNRSEIQKSILKALKTMAKKKGNTNIFEVNDLIGEIDNLEIFSKYIENLRSL